MAILSDKHLCWSLILIKLQTFKPATLLKRDINTVFSCEYYESLKNTYLEEHLWMAASANTLSLYPLETSENPYGLESAKWIWLTSQLSFR